MAKTVVDKLWDLHEVAHLGGTESLLYIDRVFLHERTGSVALKSLEAAGRKVRNPEQVFVTMDHIVSTRPGRGNESRMPGGEVFLDATREASLAAGVNLFDVSDPRQGIVHVVSPEQGIALPGVTLVCPDSHTCTLGGLGALAWGIGSTEGEHALATKTLAVKKPKNMRVTFNGTLPYGVTSKDMILALIGAHTASGGIGYIVEFAGQAVTSLPVEARLTLCNMGVEFGAFTVIVPPDDTTIEYCAGRPFAPSGAEWDAAVAHWKTLTTDPDAVFDKEISIDAGAIKPQVTWGTSPMHEMAIDAVVPDPATAANENTRSTMERALAYMDVQPGQPVEGLPIDAAFIGSCTNSRLSDLRNAAAILKGRRVAEGVRAVVVPGSSSVKRAAEAEGLDQVFKAAGFEWQESGCAMCFFAGGESFGEEERVISSTNRNFESRQGPRTRTHLGSPTTVAASAVLGQIADVRKLDPVT